MEKEAGVVAGPEAAEVEAAAIAGAKVGFVGLGVMGYPMAGHLAAAGCEVSVYNRSTHVAERWTTEYKGTALATPREVGERCDVVMLCVGNDDDVRAVCHGEDGVFAGLAAKKLLIDHTTASRELAEELAESAAARSCAALDAPVSGGQAGAEQGILTVMVGGEPGDYQRAVPFFDTYARAHRLMGPAGAGQLTKMVNQICIAGVLQGLAEGLNLGRAVGLDLEAVVEVISKGAAQSWQMENRHKTMAAGEFEFGFAVDWMRKDLGIALAAAFQSGRAFADDRAGGSVLCRGAAHGWWPVGYLEPAGTLLMLQVLLQRVG